MKQYKKFFIQTLIIAVIFIISIILFLIFIGNNYVGKKPLANNIGADYVQYWIDLKNNRAKLLDRKGHKIVFLSGSNTLYGFNSKYASEKTNLPILNYGIHAGYGNYIFEKVKFILNDGDIVILPLEFIYYSVKNSKAFSPEFINYLISYDCNYYHKLTLAEKLTTSIEFLKLYIPNYKTAKTELNNSFKKNLNDYGDMINVKADPKNISKPLEPLLIWEIIPEKYEDLELYNFIKYCEKHNITIYATMPNYYNPNSPTSKEIKAFNNIRNFYKQQNIKFIGDINAGRYNDINLFESTNYHLNQNGQEKRTLWIINNIVSINKIKEIK